MLISSPLSMPLSHASPFLVLTPALLVSVPSEPMPSHTFPPRVVLILPFLRLVQTSKPPLSFASWPQTL